MLSLYAQGNRYTGLLEASFVFDENAAVLLSNKKEKLGTRIGGIVSAELRLNGWGKIVSLAPRVS